MGGIAGLRKGAAQVINSRSNSKGTGRRGNWRMKWKPPMKPADRIQPVAEPVIFIDADYDNQYFNKETGQLFNRVDPFFHGIKHTFKRAGGRGRSGMDIKELYCSAGPNPHAPQPCIGCYEVDHGAKGADGRDFCSMNLGHLMPYHMVPLREKSTQNIIFKKDERGNPTNEPVLVEEQCAIQGCQYCQQNQQYQQNYYPLKFGAQRIFECGTGHLETVLALDTKVGMFCANCMTNIKILGYRCKNCKQPILDIATCGWTNDQIDKFAKTAYGCPACGTQDLCEEEVDCGYDPQGLYKLNGKGCPESMEPKRLTLFDCVFYLQREGKDAQTKIVDVQWVLKKDFPTPDGRPLEDHLKEIVKAPFNFADFYKPDTLDKQAQLLGVPNHYAQQGYGPQGGPPQQPQQGWGPPQGGPQYPAPPGAQPPQGFAPPQGQVPQQPTQYPNIPVPGRPNWG